ncbi:MAG: Fe-S-cluster-containing hydrogenase component 2, HycB [Candidatus Methanohalarchaeum thermophilum]|uniref:Fe-S-cluster-containing hydrogenase component 2, HycB n=1 Tax=Methanohalarchaeum thermophilum TaxID=1903181 RepID=A0A1Q6DSG0_METT1|nr:MAG: Fe-S-cluster-containing hydrogenase component 2, HycB [Candidatus Methanohalarchaeum thermophilum]
MKEKKEVEVQEKDNREGSELTRRQLLKMVAVGGAATTVGVSGCLEREEVMQPCPYCDQEFETETALRDHIETEHAGEISEYKKAKGYLVVDDEKCTECCSCMLACSLVHEGKSSLSNSRIQVLEDPFEGFPEDVTFGFCHQCDDPVCADSCPEEAIIVDEDHMNVRRVDQEKCTGCGICLEECYYKPENMVWNEEKQVAMKCDLCKNTPYWEHDKKEFACVEACPVNAIKFVEEPPSPSGPAGYYVNLRGEGWGELDLPTD